MALPVMARATHSAEGESTTAPSQHLSISSADENSRDIRVSGDDLAGGSVAEGDAQQWREQQQPQRRRKLLLRASYTMGGGGASQGTGGDPSAVRSVQLRYTWQRVVADLQPLLMAALGPEVAFWRWRLPTCADLADTASRLYKAAPDTTRLVLLRNNTWHFLAPPIGAAAAPRATRFNSSGRVRLPWPPLEPAPPGSCDFCHMQLAALYRRVSGFLERATGPGGSSASVPDMVFVVNAADNMQRFGRDARAPILSLQKWWPSDEVPWWSGAQIPTSLGRTAGQALVTPPPTPEPWEGSARAGAAQNSAGGGEGAGGGAAADGGGVGSVAAAVEHFLRRPELDDPVRLLPWLARLMKHVAKPQHERDGQQEAAASDVGAVLEQQRAAGAFDADLLLPNMAVVPRALHHVPWSDAADMAFFSGAPFCPRYRDTHEGAVCLRPYLVHLAASSSADMTVRLTAPFEGQLGSRPGLGHPVRVDAFPPTPIPWHARYRYLLSPDGYTGSYRLGALLTTSSVVLKSRSPYIEWYSRLLVPGSHYLEFWKDKADTRDVLRTLATARFAASNDPDAVRATIKTNQDIAMRYLGALPRLAYVQAALLVYRSLLPDMDTCVADLMAHLQDAGRPLRERETVAAAGWDMEAVAAWSEGQEE